MARKPREFEIGGIYHVVNRGVEQRKIFLKNQDYNRFILGLEFFNSRDNLDLWDLLARSAVGSSNPSTNFRDRLKSWRRKQRNPITKLLAFALMPNHFHLILQEIITEGISLFMQKLGSGYPTYFNKQYDRIGSLFQSRYKSVSIKNNTQLNNVFVYVHTNPVELVEAQWKDFKVHNATRAIKYLEDYKWSSYQDYIGRSISPTVTQRDFFLKFYQGEKNCQKAVEEWIRFKAENAQLGPEIIE